MQKSIIKIFNFQLWIILVLAGLFIMLPQCNNQDYILFTITTKLIFFLYVLVVLLGLYTLSFVRSKTVTFSFSKLDLALLLLLVYISLNRYLIQSHFGFSVRYIELLGLSFLYLILRVVLLKNYPWLLLAIVISGIIQAVYGIMQLWGYCDSNHSGFKVTGSFFNPGPYAGFLVSVWSVALGMYLFKDTLIKQVHSQINSNYLCFNQAIQYVFDCILLGGLVSIASVLPVTQSRAAWIAGVIGSAVLLELKYSYFRKFFKKIALKFYKIILVVVILGIFCIAILGIYFYKKGSSDGRLFIWKVTTEMIADNPIFGVGFDRFAAHYMNYQANYFAVNGETPEALLADNSIYAFNEGLQFVSENGFLGLLFLLIAMLVLFQNKQKENHQNEFHIAKTGLLTIGIFACFSYPMQILPIKLVLVVLLALLSNAANPSLQRNVGENNIRLRIFKTSIVLAACMLIHQTFSYTQNLKKGFTTWNNAMDNYQFEDYAAAITEFELVYPIFKKDGEFLMNYGKALSIAGESQKSITILEQAKNYQNNIVIATTLGDSYKATKQYNRAESSFKQAINMSPSKFYAPYLLANLHDALGQKEKAVTLAKQILNKKIKVPSIVIEDIRLQMRQLIAKYKSPCNTTIQI
jgi:O-antigen polymerase